MITRKKNLILLAVCSSLLGVAMPGDANPPTKLEVLAIAVDQEPTQEHAVEIQKFKFQTALLAVRVGDTVTWTNMDVVPHTVTALDGSWDSGRLKKGESFSLTVTEGMSLDYFCAYHRQMRAKLALMEAKLNDAPN